MKNLMKAFGIALIVSGIYATASAQTTPPAKTTTPPPAKTTTMTPKADKVLGKDAKGNTVYKGEKGNYYINDKGVHVMEAKDAKITPAPATTTPPKK